MTTYYLTSPLIRSNAIRAIEGAEDGMIVTVKKPTRSQVSSDKMWAMLGDIAKAKPEGRNWTAEVWKCAFMNALGHQVIFAEGLDGSGPFPIGFRSSKLNQAQMGDMITVIYKYGDEHGVEWKETADSGFADMMERMGK